MPSTCAACSSICSTTRCATAAESTGAIGVRLALLDDASALLRVDSDGPPIAPDVERHLFEPFFSTRSRGSGLGLYICRELCERYGASIEYRLRPDGHRNLFLVTMRRAAASRDPGRAPAYRHEHDIRQQPAGRR